MLILPLIAIYQVEKTYSNEALSHWIQYGQITGEKIARMIHIITSIPGLSSLLWFFMPFLMRKTNTLQKGYQRRIFSENNEWVAVGIFVCPLFEATKKV